MRGAEKQFKQVRDAFSILEGALCPAKFLSNAILILRRSILTKKA